MCVVLSVHDHTEIRLRSTWGLFIEASQAHRSGRALPAVPQPSRVTPDPWFPEVVEAHLM